MVPLSNMRKVFLLLLIGVLLVSCASTRTTRVGATAEATEIVLNLLSASFLDHGYVIGDWIGVEADNFLIRARISKSPSAQYPTLVVGGENLVLHLPPDSVVLGPFKNKNVHGSVHLGGTFVFTL